MAKKGSAERKVQDGSFVEAGRENIKGEQMEEWEVVEKSRICKSRITSHNPLDNEPRATSRWRHTSMDAGLLRLACHHEHLGLRQLIRRIPDLLCRDSSAIELDHLLDWIRPGMSHVLSWHI